MVSRKVLKMNNKSDNFYLYMGRFFGSRVIQNKLNDRIFDDSNKEWYILLEEDKPVAFVSLVGKTIKNVYSARDEQLEYLLNELKNEVSITDSIVPTLYLDTYKKVGLIVSEEGKYKNFVMVGSKEG